MKSRLSILIVDSHWIAASGLSSLVLSFFSGATVAMCHSVEDAVEWSTQNHFERLLILTDFWLNDGTALDIYELFDDEKEKFKMIVLSGDEHPKLLPKLESAGVWGYIPKFASPNQLIDIISMAINNLPPRLHDFPGTIGPAKRYSKSQLLEMNAEELGVTFRQFDILHHVLLGRSNKIIARELNISEPTVKEHITRILAHFGVSNRLNLIRYFANLRMTVKKRRLHSHPTRSTELPIKH